MIFGFRGPQNPSVFQFSKCDTKTVLLYHLWVRISEKGKKMNKKHTHAAEAIKSNDC